MGRTFGVKVCARCSSDYTPSGSCQKVCRECKTENDKERMHLAHVKRYVRKGYTLRGSAHPLWKDGIGTYRKMKIKESCERCSSTKFLLIHHKDENRRNNELSNLEVLCKSCHQRHHIGRDASTGRFRDKLL